MHDASESYTKTGQQQHMHAGNCVVLSRLVICEESNACTVNKSACARAVRWINIYNKADLSRSRAINLLLSLSSLVSASIALY
jgi:hypothetical protein